MSYSVLHFLHMHTCLLKNKKIVMDAKVFFLRFFKLHYFKSNIIWGNNALVDEIQSASQLGGSPDLNNALQTALNDVWSQSSSSRLKFLLILMEGSNVPNVTILILELSLGNGGDWCMWESTSKVKGVLVITRKRQKITPPVPPKSERKVFLSCFVKKMTK